MNQIKQKIGKYEIISQLGNNSIQGRVTYKAIDSEVNQKVVIKQFKFATESSQWSGYKSLEKEINILQQLDHHLIPKYIETIDDESGYCLVQEYIDALNCEEQTLNQQEVFSLAQQILEILIYIHSKNIIHKDIKPANILWDRNNQKAYLVDFGFSSLLHNHGASSTLAGTIGFMSMPQMFRGEISPQTDLYSFGVTLYVLLSGIRSEELGKQLDSRYKVPVNTLDSIVSETRINWIEFLLENKFNSAEYALNHLKLIKNIEDESKELIYVSQEAKQEFIFSSRSLLAKNQDQIDEIKTFKFFKNYLRKENRKSHIFLALSIVSFSVTVAAIDWVSIFSLISTNIKSFELSKQVLTRILDIGLLPSFVNMIAIKIRQINQEEANIQEMLPFLLLAITSFLLVRFIGVILIALHFN